MMPQSLHLEHELEGTRDLVARALWRMFLNHEWMSLLVVRGECIRLARSVQGMMCPPRRLGQATMQDGWDSYLLLKRAVSLLTLSWSRGVASVVGALELRSG